MGKYALVVTDRQLIPPWTGNRIRIHGLIRALRVAGWKVALVASNPGPIEQLNSLVDDVVLVRADPFTTGDLSSFDARPFRRGVQYAASRFRPLVAIAEYAWLAPALGTLPRGIECWVDCHDLLHERVNRFGAAGLHPWTICSDVEEIRLLCRTDVVIASQFREAEVLRTLLPHKRVICLLPEIPLPRGFQRSSPRQATVLTVGARHEGNQGIVEFARDHWPRVLARIPNARLVVVGAIGARLERLPQVCAIGHVSDMAAHYSTASVVVCPVTVGTGVKIKMLEALRLGKAVVATANAAEGLPVPRDRAWVTTVSLAGCADAIASLLADAAGRLKLENAAFAYGEEHLASGPFQKQVHSLLPGSFTVRVRSLLGTDRVSFGSYRPKHISRRRGRIRVPHRYRQGAEASGIMARDSYKASILGHAGDSLELSGGRFTAGVVRASVVGRHEMDHLAVHKISVIVPTVQWTARFAACLQSIKSQAVETPLEIVVVINGPDADLLPLPDASIKVVHEPKPGPAAARNTGVSSSTGDVLAFIDSDCVASPVWLFSAFRALLASNCTTIIAGSISRSGADGGLVSLYDCVNYLQQRKNVTWAGAFVTANLVVHRSIFDRVGPFDERFDVAAFEDWDWATRARGLGIPIKYDPGALVDHPCMSTLAQLRSKAERLARGEFLWRRKHGYPLIGTSLISNLQHEVGRALRNRQLFLRDRLQLAYLGLAVGFWTWRASRANLRLASLP